ncbi:MAG: FtsX-like permease family protein [Planctomycetota bacterium]
MSGWPGGRFGLVRGLILGDAKRHPLSLLLTVLGVTLGVAVVVGVDTAVDACTRGFAASVRSIVGDTSHRIEPASGTMADEAFAELRLAMPDLLATPVIDRRVRILPLEGAPEGEPTRLGRIIGLDVLSAADVAADQGIEEALEDASFQSFIAEPGAVVMVKPLAERVGAEVGTRLRVDMGDAVRSVHVVSIIELEPPARSTVTDLMVADIATAQELFSMPGHLDRVDIAPRDDAELEAVRGVLPVGVSVRTLDDAAGAIEELIGAYRLNLLALSFMASFVAVFIVYNATLIGAERRSGTLGTLRCVGMRSVGIAGVFVIEAAVIGLIGAAVGVFAGLWLASGLVELVSATIGDLYTRVNPVEVSLSPVSAAKAAVVGLVSALAGAAAPTVLASRTPPMSAFRATERADRSWAWSMVLALAAVGCLALAWVFVVWPQGSIVGAFAVAGFTATGFALVALPATKVASALASVLAGGHRSGRALPPLLAARGVGRSIGVTGVAVAATALAMAMNIGLLTMVGSFRHAVLTWLDGRYQSDLYIAPALALEHRVPATLSPELIAAVEAHPDVAGPVMPYRHVNIELGGLPALLTATDLRRTLDGGLLQLVDGDTRSALDALDGEPPGAATPVYISQPLAVKLGFRPGDTISLPAPEEPFPAFVAGVYTDFVADRGTVLIDRTVFRAVWHDDGLNAAHVSLEPHARGEGAAARFADVWGAEFPVVVHDHADIRSETKRIFDRTFRITDVLAWLAGLVALFGLGGAVLALAASRTRELATLSALGMSRGQLLARSATEAALLGLTAWVLALIAGSALAWILADVIQYRSFGWSFPLRPAPVSWGVALAFVVAAAVVGGLAPSLLVRKDTLVRGLGDE